MIPLLRPLLIAFALLCLACARDRNGKIESIVIRGLPCHTCSQGVLLNASGLIAPLLSNVGDPVERLTADDRAKVRALIAQLPLDDVEKAGNTGSSSDVPGRVSVDLTFDDGRREAATLAQPSRFAAKTEIDRWLRSVDDLAGSTLFRSRAQHLKMAFQSNAVRSIELETLGCYGPCARYSVVFTNANVATISGSCDATSPIPFTRVLVASRNIPWLLPHYATSTIDSFGARISVQLLDGSSFSSEGHASEDWDEFFRVTEARLDQIVRDAVWTPPIDGPACRRMAGSALLLASGSATLLIAGAGARIRAVVSSRATQRGRRTGSKVYSGQAL